VFQCDIFVTPKKTVLRQDVAKNIARSSGMG
jgi:hypothetical protein